MTYFCKGYGYHESGRIAPFSVVFDLEDTMNADIFIKTVEKTAGLSSFRHNKEIVFENIIKL